MAITGGNAIGFCTALSVALLVGLYYHNSGSVPQHQRTNDILDAMLQIESKSSVSPGLRIAVGYGACRDLSSTGAAVIPPPEGATTSNHYSTVATMTHLQELYALFFAAGSAAERYVSSSELFSRLVGASSAAAGHWWQVGGNAPVMAARLAKEGATVMLGARRTPFLADRLPPNITFSSGDEAAEDDSTGDVHLILEYGKGELWAGLVAPRANRLILHSDTSNPLLEAAEGLGARLKHFSPRLLVVSGLQMMDNYPFKTGERVARLQVVQQQMVEASERGTLVHLELASFTDQDLMTDLITHILPHAHSIGMNEQELPNLHSSLVHGNMSLLSHHSPRVATVLDLMRQVFSAVSGREQQQLSRLHVHTLGFQALAVVRGSPWRRTAAAATKAALTATRYVCANQQISLAASTLLMDDGFRVSDSEGARRVMFDAESPVACWQEQHLEVCVAPVLVCTAVKQTAGAGDNISAAGLVLQV